MPTKAMPAVLPRLMIGMLAAVTLDTAQAAESASYTIPASDGYGIVECLRAGSDCGRGLANSWCEAHGHAHAIAYGSTEDVTGTITASDKVFQVAAGDIVIRCGD